MYERLRFSTLLVRTAYLPLNALCCCLTLPRVLIDFIASFDAPSNLQFPNISGSIIGK
jgi:hypothetical protein